jgi:hypothetical protein
MNVLRFCDMNSISVGAMPWCSYHKIGSFDVYAFLKREMHLWCVFYPQVIYGQIVAVEESHGLYIHNKKIKKVVNRCSTNKKEDKNILK